jgi:hypothetical protein
MRQPASDRENLATEARPIACEPDGCLARVLGELKYTECSAMPPEMALRTFVTRAYVTANTPRYFLVAANHQSYRGCSQHLL